MEGITEQIINEILQERERQESKWGEQNHHPLLWMAILMEEVGEASKALVVEKGHREELVQVAAVAIAAIESWDRNGWDK